MKVQGCPSNSHDTYAARHSLERGAGGRPLFMPWQCWNAMPTNAYVYGHGLCRAILPCCAILSCFGIQYRCYAYIVLPIRGCYYDMR